MGWEEYVPPPLPCLEDQVKSKTCIRPGCGKEFREFHPVPSRKDYRTCAYQFSAARPDEAAVQQTKVIEKTTFPGKGGLPDEIKEEVKWLGMADGVGCMYHWGSLEIASQWDKSDNQVMSKYRWSCCKQIDADAPGCQQAQRHMGPLPRLCAPNTTICQLVPPKERKRKPGTE